MTSLGAKKKKKNLVLNYFLVSLDWNFLWVDYKLRHKRIKNENKKLYLAQN